ncbi:DUF397 domain-containing protein [Streptomyces sp. AV19]|nr:DUF397 domain-containing protein [Streptomyces sp. AV19]MBH1937256.1 DUF397 domain-containing protein [Streptomyces sp. AV19]MDG4536734.1 DUF397 domain-containing protein [Streptomyces sp. AV19]
MCVEWAPGFIFGAVPIHGEPEWGKSSHSEGNGGECVEWAPGPTSATVPIRDSKRPHTPGLLIPTPSWSAFVAHVKNGT